MAGAAQLQTHPYTWTEGDRRPFLTGTLTQDGSPINITGYTFTADLRQVDGTVVNPPVVITDGPNGIFQVQWAAGDLLEGKGQLLEIHIDDGSTLLETKALLINVRENAS